MPTYDYRCRFCGPFTQVRSIREDTASSTCPECEAPATRQFTVPMLIDRSSPVRRAQASAEASSSEPTVVRRERPVADPAPLPGKLAGLPRP